MRLKSPFLYFLTVAVPEVIIMLVNPERKVTRRLVIGGFGVVSAAFFGLPLLQLNNTLRVFGKVLGSEVDCADNHETKEKDYPFDAIVIPGAGSVWTDHGSIPNTYGQLRLEAAAIAYQKKIAPRIILLDGVNHNGESLISKDFLKNIFRNTFGQELPEEAIITETNSKNTASNMRELSKITKELDIRKVLIITNAFHRTRSTLLACQYNVAASSVSAEELIIEADPDRKQEIHALYHTREVGNLQNHELLKIIGSLWDSKGRLSILLKELER